MNVRKTIREWMLPIAMLTGASCYLLYHALPAGFHRAGPVLEGVIGVVQPLLIFSMLFLTFSRIEPKEMKPHRWHWWLLLIQGGFFTLLGLGAYAVLEWVPSGHHEWVVLIECAMLCLICPTATAAAVVTRKLGGDVAGITTYTVLINMLVAFLVPLIVPLIQPMDGVDFWVAFSMILAKVFPLLIMPCLAAWLVRYLLPRFHRWLLGFPDLAFHIWAVSLTLAIAVSMKYLMASTLSLGMIGLMALVSLACCALQFALGRYVGGRYRSRRQRLRQDMSGGGLSGGVSSGGVSSGGVSSGGAQVSGSQSVTIYACSPKHAGVLRNALQDRELQGTEGVAAADGMLVRRRKGIAGEIMDERSSKVTSGQALGQKNTVFAIWMAYTFMTPETAIVGGLYSIWHNIYNAWQLHRADGSSEV